MARLLVILKYMCDVVELIAWNDVPAPRLAAVGIIGEERSYKTYNNLEIMCKRCPDTSNDEVDVAVLFETGYIISFGFMPTHRSPLSDVFA